MYVTTIIVYRRRDKMSKKVEFHGSDLEKIEEYYGIVRHRTACFIPEPPPKHYSQAKQHS